jgi:acetoin:2,6-dichlorophenolindophenol oxidoreductase subunit beta
MSTLTEIREITFAQAINEALHEEMERDEKVIVIGEDVAAAGGVFKLTDGLLQRFGSDRVLDSPISEAGITGIGVGAAMTGMRPVVEIMFGDFLTLVMDQLVNQAAKMYYMSGGRYRVPLVVRTTLGAGRRLAAQHSQSLQAWFAHIPGLKVVLPSTPSDAKGLLKTAIRDDNPVIFFEDKLMYQRKGIVPSSSDPYTIPFGKADVKREGSDVTIVATSSMVHVALQAAENLANEKISVEVIDPRTLTPLDEEGLVNSVKKTCRCLVIDEGYKRFGVTAEIAALISQKAFYHLEAPVARIGALDVPVPFSPILEDQTIPNVEQVIAVVRRLVKGNE